MSRFLGRTSAGAAQIRVAESVPVAERLRVTQYLRLAAIGLLMLCAFAAPQVLEPGRRQAILTTLVYMGVVSFGEVLSPLDIVGMMLVGAALAVSRARAT